VEEPIGLLQSVTANAKKTIPGVFFLRVWRSEKDSRYRFPGDGVSSRTARANFDVRTSKFEL